MSLITVGLIAQSVGTLLLLGGYAPQIIKLHKTKNPTGISLLFWTMIALGCSLISINMYITSAPYEVQLTQALNGLGALYTLFLVMYYKILRGEAIELNKIISLVAVLIIVFVFYQIQVSTIAQVGIMFQTIGTIALLTAYLPQIVHLYRVKDATGISRWLFVILGVGLLLVTVNMIITGTSKEIIITEFVNIGLIFVQYYLTTFYQKH